MNLSVRKKSKYDYKSNNPTKPGIFDVEENIKEEDILKDIKEKIQDFIQKEELKAAQS